MVRPLGGTGMCEIFWRLSGKTEDIPSTAATRAHSWCVLIPGAVHFFTPTGRGLRCEHRNLTKEIVKAVQNEAVVFPPFSDVTGRNKPDVD